MGGDRSDAAHAKAVTAALLYLDAFDGPEPVSYTDNPARSNFTLAEAEVTFVDRRRAKDAPRLEAEGYALYARPSAVSELPSLEEIENVYLPETRALLQEITGASRVFVFASGMRFNERSPNSGARPNSRPARRVHSDFADAGALQVAMDNFAVDGRFPPGHFRCYNVWRVLSPPPQDTPLGLCDMRTVSAQERFATKGVLEIPGKPEITYDFCLYRPSPKHAWSYFSGMNRDEVLVFLGYDSRNPSLRVPHSAFDDPTCPPDAPPRASIEVRACAFFDA
ncbi:MAG: hypothetical protein JNJ73_10880 [Hyphomonadaceae bacterium]|nr:hypothetical protein [Hyphomonadaceae bacterium]